MGKGGDRYGAGRPAQHVKAEHCRSIDARRWKREGIFAKGRSGYWQWSDADTREVLATIGYNGQGDAVILDYTMNGTPMNQHIWLKQTPCNFGGERTWFACPRCRRRVAKLFLRASAGFVCRHCGRVNYASQSEDATGRAWRKQYKAEAKLGENWQRPKGMHKATRDKLVAVIFECEERRDNALAAFVSINFPGGLWR